MSPRQRAGAASKVAHFPSSTPSIICFNRHELREILELYGRKVAAGEWRDYALDFGREKAVFSVFRRDQRSAALPHREMPQSWRAGRAPISVVAATGLILKRGNELERVLAVLEKVVRLAASVGASPVSQ